LNTNPFISVVIPAYQSSQTIGKTLRSVLRQTFTGFEIIVVDSSPDQDTDRLITTQFPQIHYLHSSDRLLPHAARNRGFALAAGTLFALIDPDSYAHPDWLEQLVTAYQDLGGIIAGGVACHGTCWVENGLHLAKFDKWLPGGPIRTTDISPTINMLISRADFEKTGGFDGKYMIGDTEFSWQLTSLGLQLWFVPSAIVEHHHTGTWHSLLLEMFDRGQEFGQLRIEWGHWSKLKVLYFLLGSISGLRLVKILGRVLANAARAHQVGTYLKTFPIVASAHAARLAGEALAYWQHLARPASA